MDGSEGQETLYDFEVMGIWKSRTRGREVAICEFVTFESV